MDKLVNHYTKYAPHMLPVVRQSLELSLTADSSPQQKLTSASSPKSAAPATTATTAATVASTAATSAPLKPAATASATSSASVPSSASAAAASTPIPVVTSTPLSTSGVSISEADGTPVQSADKSVEHLSNVLSTTGLRERKIGGAADVELD